jgi:Flp pilus assembly pilin Flp
MKKLSMFHGQTTDLRILAARVARNESGQTLLEYALIIAFIAIALIGALTVLSATLGGFFTMLETSL